MRLHAIFTSVARVVSSTVLPFDAAACLGSDITYRAPHEGSFSRRELLNEITSADALICLLSVAIDAELLAAAPNLRVVANYAVGYDNIDVPLCTEKRIWATNTPDVLTEATADFTFALLLGAARRLLEGERMVREDRWQGWAPDVLLGSDVAGRTIGIIGLGRIGRAVARRARGFGMRILYTGPRPVPQAAQFGAERVSLTELLAGSDYVTIHCAASEKTYHLIGAPELANMKANAFLVNTARGSLVDEAALVAALDRGQLAGAALDVFEAEPRMSDALRRHEKVLLAPHAASATTKTRRRMGEICVSEVKRVLSGKRPEHPINPELAT
jgi:glyoxylate reductase